MSCKPIFVMRVPLRYPEIDTNKAIEQIDNKFNNEYHILLVREDIKQMKFELFNPNPNLKEIDMKHIKNMMKHIYNRKP